MIDNIDIDDEKKLNEFKASLEDRFGPAPEAVDELIKSVKLRWRGVKVGFEKITLKSEKLKGYLQVEDNDAYFQSETFGLVLQYVKEQASKCKMREYKNKLIISIDPVENVSEAIEHLDSMLMVEA